MRSLRRWVARLLRLGCRRPSSSEDVPVCCDEVLRVPVGAAKQAVAAHAHSERPACPPPAVFIERYHTVIPHDVKLNHAVCLTSDVAVLGSASLSGGDTCITGDVFVAGDVTLEGSPCVTGDVIVLGSAHVCGDVCVTGNAFVGGDLAVVGKLKVGGALCIWGSKDVQPAH